MVASLPSGVVECLANIYVCMCVSVIPSSVYCSDVVIKQYHSVKAASFSPFAVVEPTRFPSGPHGLPQRHHQ